MLFKDLKKDIIIPDKEVFINKLVKIRDVDVMLISITSEKDKNILWTLHQTTLNKEQADRTGIENIITNRSEKINAISQSINRHHFQISEINIQQQKMKFTSANTFLLNENNYRLYMKLQHFVEKGMDFTYWDEVNLSDLVLTAYQQESTEEFPQVDLAKNLDIVLKINKEFNEILINIPMNIEFGQTPKGTKYSFYDVISKKDRFFYINKLEHYDIWEEVKKSFIDMSRHEPSYEKRNKLQEQIIANTELICPKGKDLAILEYETEDGKQLNFYAKEFLDAKPMYSNSSTYILFKPESKFGNNGFESRLCMINVVEKDFNGSISVELFSWFQELPEEEIKINDF